MFLAGYPFEVGDSDALDDRVPARVGLKIAGTCVPVCLSACLSDRQSAFWVCEILRKNGSLFTNLCDRARHAGLHRMASCVQNR